METPAEIDFKDLDAVAQDLIKQAQNVRENAYVPFSEFRVGAALLAENGAVYTGCNVENASIGLSICAERTAITKAVSGGVRSFKRIAVVANSTQDTYTTPCGACRQVIKEFDKKNDIVVYCARSNDISKVFRATADQLLPYAFITYKNDEDYSS